ncbi:MAG: amino acid permease [Oscillospiraceae bacterium]|nr:amino acid permease [Oscillospiraceae bacterium]
MKKQKKGLKAWQLVMMALGTIIGGSFFLGSSVAIHAAGPSILIAYALGGVLVYFILSALSEMTVASPDSGSFRSFAGKAFGEGAGFVVGWVYWTGMVLAMSSEATAISILVQNWVPNASIPVMGSGIIIGVTMINLLGATKLSNLESVLAAFKLLAVLSFILMALGLIFGFFSGTMPVGLGALTTEPFFAGGWRGIAGSMLIVMFAYAGFEMIGLAASEAESPRQTVPRAIRYTVFSIVSLYILSAAVLLPLIPTGEISASASPIVAALNRQGFSWAGTVINMVLLTAILSTMLAAMFGLGRMMRSLADEGHAPSWLRDSTDVPYRGIVASGACMLLALWFGLMLPSVYVFLISSGGFAILFSYAVIMATHIRFRKMAGSSLKGGYQIQGYPVTSVVTLIALIAVMISMPLVQGQGTGLIAGCIILAFYTICYLIIKEVRRARRVKTPLARGQMLGELRAEWSEELSPLDDSQTHKDE